MMAKKKFKEDSQFFWLPKLMGEEAEDYKRRVLDDYEVAISILKHELGLDDEPQERHYKTHQKAQDSAFNTQVGGDHYTKLAIQPMEYSFKNKLDPCQHTAIKYITRFRDKGGKQDLEKAIDCIQMLIEMEYGK